MSSAAVGWELTLVHDGHGGGAAVGGAVEIASLQPAPVRPARAGGVQSVDRALMLLDVLAGAGAEASLTDIAARSGLNVSTCHHLLATLMRAGYVAKVPGRRTYALGARVLHLAQAFLRHVDVPRRAQPVLERLAAETGETVHMAVLQGDRVVTVARRESSQAVRVDSGIVGAAEAAHATATGKAILAWLPEQQMERVLHAPAAPATAARDELVRFTANTIVSRDALVEELRHVRRNGYALDREEFQLGVVCVGSAVRDHAGAVIGSISASAPVFRARKSDVERLRAAVTAAAAELSSDIGAQPGQTRREPDGNR